MIGPLYKLVIVKAFGAGEVELEEHESFYKKWVCERELETRLNELRTNAPLAQEGVRFGGACVLIES